MGSSKAFETGDRDNCAVFPTAHEGLQQTMYLPAAKIRLPLVTLLSCRTFGEQDTDQGKAAAMRRVASATLLRLRRCKTYSM